MVKYNVGYLDCGHHSDGFWISIYPESITDGDSLYSFNLELETSIPYDEVINLPDDEYEEKAVTKNYVGIFRQFNGYEHRKTTVMEVESSNDVDSGLNNLKKVQDYDSKHDIGFWFTLINNCIVNYYCDRKPR